MNVVKKKLSNTIALFDMDGTLTPARKKIDDSMIGPMIDLLSVTRVGIVSGSGIDYITQQCNGLFKELLARHSLRENLDILPCNGTQVYKLDPMSHENPLVKKYAVDMIQKVGEEKYKSLISKIISLTHECQANNNIPCTGTFMSYRGSMLNWAPSGRDCNFDKRQAFMDFDKDAGLRVDLVERLASFVEDELHANIDMAIGGEISIDIFPTGWDKTYALRHYPDFIYSFVGDRCTPPGNDYPIYSNVENLGYPVYNVSDPSDTIDIINNRLIPYFSKGQ